MAKIVRISRTAARAAVDVGEMTTGGKVVRATVAAAEEVAVGLMVEAEDLGRNIIRAYAIPKWPAKSVYRPPLTMPSVIR